VAYYARKDQKIRAPFINNSAHFISLVPPQCTLSEEQKKLTDNRPKVAVIKTKYYVLTYDKYNYGASLLLLLLLMTRLFTALLI
jgi:hypothetical protein